jgi:hypothetical protein
LTRIALPAGWRPGKATACAAGESGRRSCTKQDKVGQTHSQQRTDRQPTLWKAGIPPGGNGAKIVGNGASHFWPCISRRFSAKPPRCSARFLADRFVQLPAEAELPRNGARRDDAGTVAYYNAYLPPRQRPPRARLLPRNRFVRTETPPQCVQQATCCQRERGVAGGGRARRFRLVFRGFASSDRLACPGL